MISFHDFRHEKKDNITINSFVKNLKKKYNSPPLNQIYGIKKLLKFSKGEVIFLLDSDDQFKTNKLKEIF